MKVQSSVQLEFEIQKRQKIGGLIVSFEPWEVICYPIFVLVALFGVAIFFGAQISQVRHEAWEARGYLCEVAARPKLCETNLSPREIRNELMGVGPSVYQSWMEEPPVDSEGYSE